MARRKEDLPLKKITIKLFDGDVDRFLQLYPRLGVSKFLRESLHRHLRKVEESVQRAPQPVVEELDFEGIELEAGEQA